MKNPFPAVISLSIPDQLQKLKSRRALVGLGLIVIAMYALYRGLLAFVFTEENGEAGLTIVVAIETYKKQNGRYPDKLEQLKPRFIDAIPRPVKNTNFVYGTSGDGKQCWFGYQIHRAVVNEYDCQEREWSYREYEDSDALRSRNKEFVMGPKD